MALGKKKKKGKGSSSKKNWKRVGTVWESDKYDGEYERLPEVEGQLSFSVDKEAQLFYFDPETEVAYRIKRLSVFDVNDEAPEGALLNLAVNLENENQAEVDSDD